MARDKPQLNPAETVLARWASESKEQPSFPDFDPEFSASFPNLWVFLTWTQIGKAEKSPGAITLKADGSGWRLSYFDPAAKRGTAVVGQSLMDCLRRLDAALVAPDTVWSASRGPRGFRFKET